MSEPGHLLRGGVLVDGTGAAPRRADVELRRGLVTAIGPALDPRGLTVVEVDGRLVTPGFVDIHSHSDAEMFRQAEPGAKVFQGVTHEVFGQDGMGYVPRRPDALPQVAAALRNWNGEAPAELADITTVTELIAHVEGRSLTNVAMLVPHGALRLMAMADPTQRASREELEVMVEILARALEDGAVGMSGGLAYYPGQFADQLELIVLCEVVASYQGYFAPHHRNYGPTAFESYREMLEVARLSGVRLHLTHANLSFPMNKGRAEELLDLVAEYETAGCTVTFDTYPYDSGATSLFELMPSWLKSGGSTAMLERLAALDDDGALSHELEVSGSDSFHHVPMDWDRIRLTGLAHPGWKRFTSMPVSEAAATAGTTPTRFVVDALLACDLDVGVTTHYGNLDNKERLLRDPRHCVCTDGLLAGDAPHPRAYGAFAHYLAHYVRDERRVSLEEGIRKITGLPASIARLDRRGTLAVGHAADVAVIDLPRVRAGSSYAVPRARAEGFDHVFVNGVPVVLDGALTGHRPGRGLRPRRH